MGKFILVPDRIYRDKGIKDGDVKVYIAVKSYMNGNNRQCYPSRKVIAKETGRTPRSITSSLTRLESENYLKRYFRDTTTTIYEFPED